MSCGTSWTDCHTSPPELTRIAVINMWLPKCNVTWVHIAWWGGGGITLQRKSAVHGTNKETGAKKKASSPSLTSIRDGNKKIVDVQMSESTFPVRSLRFSLLSTERSQNTADDVMHQLEAALNCTEVKRTHYHIVLVSFPHIS